MDGGPLLVEHAIDPGLDLEEGRALVGVVPVAANAELVAISQPRLGGPAEPEVGRVEVEAPDPVDVVLAAAVGVRGQERPDVAADGLEAFDKLGEVTPSPGVCAVGEERAWGRRLAKRFGVDSKYEAKTFVAKSGQSGFLDFESSKPGKLDADIVEMFSVVDPAGGDVMVAYGWTMAEDLVKLGGR